MDLSFSYALPDDSNRDPMIISGADSYKLSESEYLILRDADSVVAFKIMNDRSGGPFKQAMIIGEVLAIGHEGYFYMFDLRNNMNILRMEMDGYFGHLYADNNLCYVADADGLYCIGLAGNVLWTNNNLGIDGVIINKFDDDKIYGDGEWDPPGGWRSFVLDKKTGQLCC